MEKPGDGLDEEQKHRRGCGRRSLAFGNGYTALTCIDPNNNNMLFFIITCS